MSLSNNAKSWVFSILGFAFLFLSLFIFQTFLVFTGGFLLLVGLYYSFKASSFFRFMIRVKRRITNGR
ncbi:membrane protein implicated in regulation of membrane protease activity [Natronobacillus azotifigens]